MTRLTKLAIIGISAAIFAIAASVLALYMGEQDASSMAEPEEDILSADIIMPTKVSRPGCEETDSCYVPTRFTAKMGQSVTWLNQDSAFHSVTSGTYDEPVEDFDSGYMDPYQTFTLTFEKAGVVDYFCTLHPWMEGQIIVEP